MPGNELQSSFHNLSISASRQIFASSMSNETPTEIRMSRKDSDINNIDKAPPADLEVSKPEHAVTVDRDTERKLIRRIDFMYVARYPCSDSHPKGMTCSLMILNS